MNEAELLFGEVLKCDRASLYLNGKTRLTDKESGRVAQALKRRIAGEPIQYILGKTEFFGLGLKITRDVLIPRPETELLVETALKYSAGPDAQKSAKISILDIGTGSGCIAVSLAGLLPDAQITATDISAEALKVAGENAVFHGVKNRINFLRGDLFTIGERRLARCDMIVSNPPYIPTDEISKLQPEVRREPRVALDGGRDGLKIQRRIIAGAPGYLRDNGLLILEAGFNQSEYIKDIIRKRGGLEIIEVVRDYAGINRVIVARKAR